MQSELKPCPFCGSKATLFKNERGYWGTCTNNDCDAETPGRVDPNEAASIWNRRAALSDKQAGEVKALPLNWATEKKSGFTIHVGRGLGLKYEACIKAYSPGWVVTLGQSDVIFDGSEADEENAKAAAQADYEQRIRSALVDVPAVEPVAWMIDLGDGETKITDNDIIRDRWHQNGRRVNNLYPSSPLSRGAEVIPADPTNEMIDAALSADWICDGDERAAAINVWHAMYSAALAATRSGSATSTTGTGGGSCD